MKRNKTTKNLTGVIDKVSQVVFGIMLVIQAILVIGLTAYLSSVWRFTVQTGTKVWLVIIFECAFTIMAIYQFLMYAIRLARKQNDLTNQRKLKEGWYEHFSNESAKTEQLQDQVYDLEDKLEKSKDARQFKKLKDKISELENDLEVYKREIISFRTSKN
jgi:uncharacterized protein YlxW (UPF0749 family)